MKWSASISDIPEINQDHCPSCAMTCNVREISRDHFHKTDEYDDFNSFSWSSYAFFLQCNSCQTYFLKHGYCDEEQVDQSYGPDGETVSDYYPTFTYSPPASKRPRPDWMERLRKSHNNIYEPLLDIYKATNSDLNGMAIMACRTLFEIVVADFGIAKKLSFENKIKALEVAGHIPTEQTKDISEIFMEGGHAAVHRAWSPEDTEVEVVLEIFEDFIHRMYFFKEDEAEKKARRDAVRKRIPTDTRKR